MSEKSDEETTARHALPRTPLGWLRFDGHAVLLQLATPCVGALSDAAFPRPAMNGNDPVFTKVMPGTLHVEGNGAGGVLLVLETVTVDNQPAMIAIPPDCIEYCTMAERRPLIQ